MNLLDRQRLISQVRRLIRQNDAEHNADLNAHETPIAATYAASGTVAPTTWITIGATTPVLNLGSMYDGSTLTYTIKTSGLYECSGSVLWQPRAAPANHLLLSVWKTPAGGSIFEIARWSAPGAVAGSAQGAGGTIPLNLAAGDQIQFKVYQDSGSSVNADFQATSVKFVRPTF